MAADKILVFRRGSLGDGVLTLPALHALDDRFPGAEIRLLTNQPISSRAAPMQAFLEPTGLIAGFFVFPPEGRSAATWLTLAREIRAWGPRTLAYLSEPSGRLGVLREAAFFAGCGIRRFIGLPLGNTLRRYRRIAPDLWETEASRLLRAVGAATPADAWEAGFTDDEEAAAERLLADIPRADRIAVLCVGGKGSDKDWGDANWRAVLDAVADRHPDLALVTIGAAEEAARADALTADWRGPVLNLCGQTPPRVAGLVMRRARFYLGHDSGPMHLAALVRIPCVAVISARAKPGVWFPQGEGHRVFYPWEQVDSVPDTAGFRDGGDSIRTLPPGPVIEACLDLLKDDGASP